MTLLTFHSLVYFGLVFLVPLLYYIFGLESHPSHSLLAHSYAPIPKLDI